METVKHKKRGRPATGHTPIIALRLAADEIQLVDELGAELKVDRSKALRTLLREGFAAYTRKKRRTEAARRRATATNAAIVEDVLEEQSWRERVANAPKRQPGRRPSLRLIEKENE